MRGYPVCLVIMASAFSVALQVTNSSCCREGCVLRWWHAAELGDGSEGGWNLAALIHMVHVQPPVLFVAWQVSHWLPRGS